MFCLLIFGMLNLSQALHCLTMFYWEWKMKVAQLCLTLCNSMDYTIHGILQARIQEWVTLPFSRESSQPRDPTKVSCIAGRFFTSWVTWHKSLFPVSCVLSLDINIQKVFSVSHSVCPTLCNLIYCSPPSSSCPCNSPGKNTWVPFFRGSSWPRDRIQVSHLGFFTIWATREAPKVFYRQTLSR